MPTRGRLVEVPPLSLVRVTSGEAREPDKRTWVHLSTPASTFLTLCGWVDVDNEAVEEGVPTCPNCLDVLASVAAYLKRSVSPTYRRRVRHGA